MPSHKSYSAVLKTLVYADIFDFPLKKKEIIKRLIGLRVQTQNVKLITKSLLPKDLIIKDTDGYYYLEGRQKIVHVRQQREKFSEMKNLIARQTVRCLKFIPSIKLIGVSGALAVNNAKKDDDIDFFIVTSEGLLWTTRFLILVILFIFGKKRNPNDLDVKDKICVNMLVDQAHLSLSKKDQDIFSAHEVVQMKPMYEKEQIYTRFLYANNWIRKYLPNTPIPIISQQLVINYNKKNSTYIISQLLNYLEILLKKIQLWYMRNRRTSEVISTGIIRFHPLDARKWILEKYHLKLEEILMNLQQPLDK